MVAIPLGPATADLNGVRAGDRNLITGVMSAKGAPLDLTGKTLSAQARKKATDPDPPALTATMTVTDAAAGEFSMQWPGDDVRALLDGAAKWTGVWDLQIEESGVDPLTVCAGKFECETDVTR